MLCSCGKQGVHELKRREMPYCQECFEHLLSKLVRSEVPNASIELQDGDPYYTAACSALCLLAKRQVTFISDNKKGLIPGCQETQAVANMQFLLGYCPKREVHFPSSITREELQRFFKGVPPKITTVEEELSNIEQTHPGTIASVAKWNEAQHAIPPRRG
jgi:hypothetical protein